jgi:hypothetical protein
MTAILHNIYYDNEGKDCPVHAMNAYRGMEI